MTQKAEKRTEIKRAEEEEAHFLCLSEIYVGKARCVWVYFCETMFFPKASQVVASPFFPSYHPLPPRLGKSGNIDLRAEGRGEGGGLTWGNGGGGCFLADERRREGEKL